MELTKFWKRAARSVGTMLRLWILPGQSLHLLLVSLYCRIVKPTIVFGIRLVPMSGNAKQVQELMSALKLIQKVDPRRFVRVRRFVKLVVLRESRKNGQYFALGGVCTVKPLTGNYRNPDTPVHVYASVLVHEATHGLLEKKRFPYCGKNKQQIERICEAEHKRFFARLFPGFVVSVKPTLQRKRSSRQVTQ